MPMPGVFSAINSRIQSKLVGQNLRTLAKDLPDCEIIQQEAFVESKVIPGTDVYIKGKYDLLARNNDGTYTIIDLKISQADEGKIDKYKTQLGAYKFALENPKDGEPLKITRLGLLIFYPDEVVFEEGTTKLKFPPKWLEIPIDDQSFLDFIQEVDQLLRAPLPGESATCKWCQYRHVGESLSHEHKADSTGTPPQAALVEEFTFGKYKGAKVSAIAKTDPGYLQWLLKEKIKARDQEGKNDINWIHTLEHYLN